MGGQGGGWRGAYRALFRESSGQSGEQSAREGSHGRTPAVEISLDTHALRLEEEIRELVQLGVVVRLQDQVEEEPALPPVERRVRRQLAASALPGGE